VYSLASGFAANPVFAVEEEVKDRDEFADTSIPTGEFCDKLRPIGTVKQAVKLLKTSRMTKKYNVECICSKCNHDV